MSELIEGKARESSTRTSLVAIARLSLLSEQAAFFVPIRIAVGCCIAGYVASSKETVRISNIAVVGLLIAIELVDSDLLFQLDKEKYPEGLYVKDDKVTAVMAHPIINASGTLLGKRDSPRIVASLTFSHLCSFRCGGVLSNRWRCALFCWRRRGRCAFLCLNLFWFLWRSHSPLYSLIHIYARWLMQIVRITKRLPRRTSSRPPHFHSFETREDWICPSEDVFSSLNVINIFHSLSLSLLLQETLKCVNELFTQTYYEVLHICPISIYAVRSFSSIHNFLFPKNTPTNPLYINFPSSALVCVCVCACVRLSSVCPSNSVSLIDAACSSILSFTVPLVFKLLLLFVSQCLQTDPFDSEESPMSMSLTWCVSRCRAFDLLEESSRLMPWGFVDSLALLSLRSSTIQWRVNDVWMTSFWLSLNLSFKSSSVWTLWCWKLWLEPRPNSLFQSPSHARRSRVTRRN